MFPDPEKFIEPRYIGAGCTTLNNFAIKLHACNLCGSVILDRVGHTEWHAQVWQALLKLKNL